MQTRQYRIVAYPGADLYLRLQQFKESEGIKSLSLAIIKALQNYFALVDKSEERLKLEDLSQEVNEIRVQINELTTIVQGLRRH